MKIINAMRIFERSFDDVLQDEGARKSMPSNSQEFPPRENPDTTTVGRKMLPYASSIIKQD